jgi:serine/threonine-protein kinase
MAADVPASGARLFAIRLPPDHSLALGVNGTPLLQMAVFAADGTPLSPRGVLRVVSLGRQKTSPVQLLVTNEGVASARISLSLRADPPAADPAGQSTTPPGSAPEGQSPETTPAAPQPPPASEGEGSPTPAPAAPEPAAGPAPAPSSEQAAPVAPPPPP